MSSTLERHFLGNFSKLHSRINFELSRLLKVDFNLEHFVSIDDSRRLASYFLRFEIITNRLKEDRNIYRKRTWKKSEKNLIIN